MLTMFKRLASLVPTPATSKVTLFVSDAGVPSYKDDAGLVTPMSGQPIPAGYIDGFKMEYVSGTQIRFTSGSAYIPSLGRALAMTSSVTKTPTLAANSWYHNYAYDNAGTPDIEVSTTAPAAPYSGTARTKTGDTSRRYIGSFKTGATSAILKFVHGTSDGSVAYNEGIGSAPFVVVNGGSQTVPTTADCSAIVPATARRASTVILNAATSTAAYLHISNSDGPTPGAGGGFLGLVSPNSVSSAPVTLDSNQRYTYAYEAAVGTGGSFHRVGGYFYER